MTVAGQVLDAYPEGLGGVDRQELLPCIEACAECAQACADCADVCDATG